MVLAGILEVAAVFLGDKRATGPMEIATDAPCYKAKQYCILKMQFKEKPVAFKGKYRYFGKPYR